MLTTTDCPARYDYAGLFRTDEEWIHPRRTIDSYEIIVDVSGEIYICEEDRRHTLRAGDVLVLRPGLLHEGWQPSSAAATFYWIHFRADPEALPPLPFAPTAPADAAHLLLLCRQLLHIANAPGYPAYAAQAAFALLFCEVAGLCRQTSPGTRLVSETAEWIRINSHRPLTVAAVAQQAGYHPDYLSALFRSAFHTSLKQYIAEQRMQQIRSQLLTTTDSIKQIAARLGFSGENHLLHFFRYHEGVSPSAYRNLYHRTHLNRK